MFSRRIGFFKGLIFGRCLCFCRLELYGDKLLSRVSFLKDFGKVATPLSDDSNL